VSSPDWHLQDGYDVRFEWGTTGTAALAVGAAVVAVIDVLRFTTAVEAALGRGASVFPYRWRDDSAPAFAESVGATLAEGSDPSGPSLSPLSLCRLNGGDAVVLPSPNGSTCTAIAAEAGAAVVAACLRNLSAVADGLNDSEGPVVVIACGERWSDGSLRPCIEDLLGAGALIGRLRGSRSPEAESAARAWDVATQGDVATSLHSSGSGRELHAKDHGDDVTYAAELDVSTVVPVLRDGRFVNASAVPRGD
jgi:2-phosphosulfolactate phosphatase